MSENRSVLITGATGFIGCRLAERLSVEKKVAVKALIHRSTGPGLTRLARLPVELVHGDLNDLDSLVDAAQGCDVIVHCGFGSRGTRDEMEGTTITGTENVMKAALAVKANRLVHLSTVSVYGNSPAHAVVTESTERKPDKDLYSQTKTAAEEVVWEFSRENELPVVVLRPGVVYGPHGNLTRGPIKDIKSGAVLVDGARGLCNVVYIDNLIDAIMLSMEHESALGEDFIVVDDDIVTWHQYYHAYAELLRDVPPIQDMPLDYWKERRKEIERSASMQPFTAPARALGHLVRHVAGSEELRGDVKDELRDVKWVRLLYKAVPGRGPKPVESGPPKRTEPPSPANGEGHPPYYKVPHPGVVGIYSAETRFSNDKIKRLLNWTQGISFQEAMDLTGIWAREDEG